MRSVPSFDPIERWNLALSAGAIATSLVLASPLFATSLAVGAILEAVNFRGLRRSAQLMFDGALPGQRGFQAVFGLRFVLLAGGIAAALWAGADAVGLVVGLSLIMPAAVIEAWRARPPVDPAARALDPDDPAWERWDPWLARERAEEDDEAEAA